MRAHLLGLLAVTAAISEEHHHHPECDLAIIGGGPGGAYLAARAALDDPAKGSVCLFERGTRVGGRVHSLRKQGPKEDLVVEAGAYRFALNETCMNIDGFDWCVATPLTRAIVIDYLDLKWKRYNPDAADWDHELAKIVTAEGKDAGFLTFVEDLVARAERSGRFSLHFGYELTSIDVSEATHALRFANGVVGYATKVALNLPQGPLLEVLSRSTGFETTEADVPEVLHAMLGFPIAKFYAYYDDAWWRNILGLASGTFNNSDAWSWPDDPNAMARMDCLAARQAPLALQGSYHDGDVSCDGDGNECYGYIQAAYMGDVQVVRDLQQYHFPAQKGDAVSHLDPSTSPRDARLLTRVHEALVDVHRDALVAAGALAAVEKLRPASGVLSIWDTKAVGLENACHMAKATSKGGAGVAPRSIPATAARPYAKTAPNVYVANEAFGPIECFAEGSLAMAENVLYTYLSIPKPAWIDDATYFGKVIFNATADEAAPPFSKGKSHPMGDLAYVAAAAASRKSK